MTTLTRCSTVSDIYKNVGSNPSALIVTLIGLCQFNCSLRFDKNLYYYQHFNIDGKPSVRHE